MRQRKMVAAFVLAASMALPAATQELRGDTGISEAQWAYALGMSRKEALGLAVGGAIMCSFIPNPGAAGCAIVGAF